MSEQFRTVLRGYDPAEVDRIIGTLRAERDAAHRETAVAQVDVEKLRMQLGTLDSRGAAAARRIAELEEAERNAAPPTYTDLGARVGSILTLANEEATELRHNAKQEAAELLTSAQAERDRLLATAQSQADETRSRSEAEATRVVATAKQAADELLDVADREAGARREEAEAVYEHQRARAAAAAAEFERTLAERRDRSAADFARALAAQDQKMAAAEDRLRASQQEAERLLSQAKNDAASLAAKTAADADHVLATAKERADRVRRESDRELAAATARRDAITAQLSNVRQMLATLGGAAVLNPLSDEPSAEPAVLTSAELAADDNEAAPAEADATS